MSLGLLSGYGSGSDSDEGGEDENQIHGVLVDKSVSCGSQEQQSISLPTGESIQDRLKHLAGKAVEVPEDLEFALSMPPPPPPEVLPNPLKPKKSKQKLFPAIGRREMELLKTAEWTHITTSDNPVDKQEFEYNTPLPFNSTEPDGSEEMFEEDAAPPDVPQPAEFDYVSYVAEYQNYLANSAALLEGQKKSQEAAEASSSSGGESSSASTSALDNPEYKSSQMDEWNEYMQKYSEWYAQYGGQAAGVSAPAAPTQIRQKSFEELVEQDRQLKAYFESAPANEYNSQRDAFKSSFRGTRMYRMRNGTDKFNPKHFNQLSLGAKTFSQLYPKQKSVFVDKDAYVADKDLPENQDPKSMKQRKKDKWFERMKKKGGCKKCGFVFCRCYGWEYKPSHVK